MTPSQALTLPDSYSAMECRLAFDWLQTLAQQPDAPPFAAVALAAWHALATAAPVEPVAPVAEVIWHDPTTALFPPKPGKIIDASLAFMDAAPLGTKLYAAPVPAEPALTWRPIETAPKDASTKIIVRYLNRNGMPRTVMACWLTDEQAAETDADGVGLEGGWYECIDNWPDYTEVAIHEGEPTHWMPIPAAPKE